MRRVNKEAPDPPGHRVVKEPPEQAGPLDQRGFLDRLDQLVPLDCLEPVVRTGFPDLRALLDPRVHPGPLDHREQPDRLEIAEQLERLGPQAPAVVQARPVQLEPLEQQDRRDCKDLLALLDQPESLAVLEVRAQLDRQECKEPRERLEQLARQEPQVSPVPPDLLDSQARSERLVFRELPVLVEAQEQPVQTVRQDHKEPLDSPVAQVRLVQPEQPDSELQDLLVRSELRVLREEQEQQD